MICISICYIWPSGPLFSPLLRIRTGKSSDTVCRSLFHSTSSNHELISSAFAVMGKVEEDADYLRFSEHYLPWHGHVTALTVAPQYRRLGIAKALTEALERGCEEQDAWFVDLFVRAGNDTAKNLYKGMGYTVYRRVEGYYNDDPTGRASGEDAFDMRKPLKRDKNKAHIRENGEKFKVQPEDVYR